MIWFAARTPQRITFNFGEDLSDRVGAVGLLTAACDGGGAARHDEAAGPGQARWAGGAAELRLTSHFRLDLELKSEMLKSRECVSVYAGSTQCTVVQCSAARQQQTPFLLQLYFRYAASMAQDRGVLLT